VREKFIIFLMKRNSRIEKFVKKRTDNLKHSALSTKSRHARVPWNSLNE